MEKQTSEKSVTIIVHGRVQGVGFRYFTQKNASRIGVAGRVRNRADGTVEIHAEGSESKLKQLLARVQKGPSHADVQKIDVNWKESRGRYKSFEVSY
jgi:acylphosphatase